MPADPATLRALAARVMAGENTDDLNEYIFNATAPHGDGIKHRLWQDMNGKMRLPYGMFFRDLNAADALFAPLRERGWRLRCGQKDADTWYAIAHRDGPCEIPIAASPAPTEPAARVALALLCLATEGEAGE